MRLTGQQKKQIKLNVGKHKAIYLLGKSNLSFLNIYIYMCFQLINIAQWGFSVSSHSFIKLLEQNKKSKAIPGIIKERNTELTIKHKYHTQQTNFFPPTHNSILMCSSGLSTSKKITSYRAEKGSTRGKNKIRRYIIAPMRHLPGSVTKAYQILDGTKKADCNWLLIISSSTKTRNEWS